MIIKNKLVYSLVKVKEFFIGNSKIVLAIKNSGWLFLEKIIRMFFSLLVGAWVARYLGPENFGILSYALAFLAFFQTISLLGLDSIVVKYLSSEQYNNGELIGTSFSLRLIVGCISYILAIFTIVLNNGLYSDEFYIVVIVGFGMLFQSLDTVDLWFQSQSKSRITVKVKLCVYLIINISKIIAIYLQSNIIIFAVITLLEIVFFSLGLFFSYLKYPCGNKFSFNKKLAVKLLLESWPFILSGLSIIIYMRIDQIMIRHFLDVKMVGLYAAALPFSTVWNFIPLVLATSFAPVLALKRNSNITEYYTILTKLFRVVFLISLFLCIFTTCLSPFIIKSLYGAEYLTSYKVLSIHVFTNIFISLGVIQNIWIVNEKKSLVSLYNTILGMVFCLVGNFIFIPIWGVLGAAGVAVFSQFVSAMLGNFFFARQIFIIQLKTILFKWD